MHCCITLATTFPHRFPRAPHFHSPKTERERETDAPCDNTPSVMYTMKPAPDPEPPGSVYYYMVNPTADANGTRRDTRAGKLGPNKNQADYLLEFSAHVALSPRPFASSSPCRALGTLLVGVLSSFGLEERGAAIKKLLLEQCASVIE